MLFYFSHRDITCESSFVATDQSSDGSFNQSNKISGAVRLLNLFRICASKKEVVERRVKLSAISASQLDLLGVCEVWTTVPR